MKKLFASGILLLICGFTLAPLTVTAAGPVEIQTEGRVDGGGSVKILETIYRIGAGDTPSLGNYIRNGYTFAIGAAGVIAVVQLVFAGIQYIYFGFSEGSIGKAKARATNALYGLLAVLFTYVILQIINPGLVNNSFDNIVTPLSDDILKVNAPSTGGIGGRPDTGGGTAGLPRGGRSSAEILTSNCTNCVSLDGLGASFSYDGGVNRNIAQPVATKLVKLDQALDSLEPKIGWKINEAFPPVSCNTNPANCLTRHSHPCHRNGTCIDAGLTSDPLNGKKLQAFADAAKGAGLYAEYEVRTSGEKEAIEKSGFKGCVKVLGSHISGAHFSVYSVPEATC